MAAARSGRRLSRPPHDATGHTWHHDNRLLFDYTKLGGEALFAARGIRGPKSGMQGFADVLTDDGIWDILAYIRSTWPERVKEVQPRGIRPTTGSRSQSQDAAQGVA